MSRNRGSKFVDWTAVDWSKHDMNLSFKHGVSRSHVVGMRKKFGRPYVKVGEK